MPRWLVVLAVVGLIFAVMAPASADDVYVDNVVKTSHKVVSKWDQTGTFVSHPGINWGFPDQATWTYKVHVKEAMDGDYSVGSIHLYAMQADGTEIDVVGKVEATNRPYLYWTEVYPQKDARAAVGTAEYNDSTYYFMFLESEKAMWLALSSTPYQACWDEGNVWGGSGNTCDGRREFQVHSWVPEETFVPLPEKIIHE